MYQWVERKIEELAFIWYFLDRGRAALWSWIGWLFYFLYICTCTIFRYCSTWLSILWLFRILSFSPFPLWLLLGQIPFPQRNEWFNLSEYGLSETEEKWVSKNVQIQRRRKVSGRSRFRDWPRCTLLYRIWDARLRWQRIIQRDLGLRYLSTRLLVEVLEAKEGT